MAPFAPLALRHHAAGTATSICWYTAKLERRRSGHSLRHRGVAEHRVVACLAGGLMEQRTAAVNYHCRNAVNGTFRDRVVQQRLDGRTVEGYGFLLCS